jgi:hypothetical protein
MFHFLKAAVGNEILPTVTRHEECRGKRGSCADATRSMWHQEVQSRVAYISRNME